MVTSTATLAVAGEPSDDKRELRVGNLKVNKVLFLGNSITLHGPLESIGWSGNWGMAASQMSKDYVHLVLAKIEAESKGKPDALIRNVADFERQYATFDIEESLRESLAFKADLIILAIGENVSPLTTPVQQAEYQMAVAALLRSLRHSPSTRVYVRSTFWSDSEKNKAMLQACEQSGAVFIDLGRLDSDETNFARAERRIEHAGVAAHPGDKGMEAIANGLWKAILESSLNP